MDTPNSTSSGARAALAGYRKQFLYTLQQALGPASHRLRVEGLEDLDILDQHGNVVELVQVKAYDRDLTLSHIRGFLDRTAEQLGVNPQLRARLVSFGPIGRELQGAWAEAGPEREAVGRKLLELGIEAATVDRLFAQVALTPVSEQEIEAEVRAHLEQLPTAADPEASFALLMFWIYASAEQSLVLDREDLRDRLDLVSRYVVERGVWVREWFSNIVPLAASAGDLARTELEREYRQGIGARIDHILAGLDVERPTGMERLSRAFDQARVVILRGLSGQGKSTLAYRWLHDQIGSANTLEIREIRDRQHARELAIGITAYLRATGLQLTIVHDVRPGDTHWVELLREFAPLANVRLLVTIREDDWRRASVDVPASNFVDVELTLDESEAREIHQRLAARTAIAHFHDFDEAWARFGGGPMLEWVYLLTQPTSLRERLRQQLERLTDDEATRPGLLRLLRWTVFADAYGSRLDARATARSLGLSEPGAVFARLEREYLLRHAGGLLTGVHAVRSGLLVELLLERDAEFESWLDTAIALLPVLVEQDREVFLLHAFSRRVAERDRLVRALAQLDSQTWEGVRGVLTALVWLGVANYGEQNSELIDEIQREEATTWYVVLALDVVGLESETGEKPVDLLTDVGSVPDWRRAQIAKWRSRFSDPDRVLTLAREWLELHRLPDDPPSMSADWDAAAEVAFWAGHLGVQFCLDERWSKALEKVLDELDSETLANVNYGAWRSNNAVFADQHAEFVHRFEAEFDVLRLDDDGEVVRVQYLVPHERLHGKTSAEEDLLSFLNGASVRRCELLRRLFPDCQRWGAQGVGHKFAGFPHDPSYREMPKKYLPPREIVRFSAAFVHLGTLRLRRETWPEWCKAILEHRRTICDGMDTLIRAVVGYFQQKHPVNLREAGLFKAPPYTQIHQFLFTGTPPFPKCSVDEWGFTSEAATGQAAEWLASHQLGLRRHERVRKVISDFLQSLRFFIQQGRHAIELQPLMAIANTDSARQLVHTSALESGVQTEAPRLSLHNLAAGYQKLPELQREFRGKYSSHVDVQALVELEARENEVFETMLALWHEFVYWPGRVKRKKVKQDALKALHEDLRKHRIKLRNACSTAEQLRAHGSLREIRDNIPGSPGLWLVLDTNSAQSGIDAATSILEVVRANLPPRDSVDHRTFATRTMWPEIHVVTLVRGRVANASYSQVSYNALMVYGNEATVGFKDISPELLDALGLERYDHPLLVHARSYVEYSIHLRVLVAHAGELEQSGGSHSEQYRDQLDVSYEQTRFKLVEVHVAMHAEVSALMNQPRYQAIHAFAELAAMLDVEDADSWIAQVLGNSFDQEVWKRTVDSVAALSG